MHSLSISNSYLKNGSHILVAVGKKPHLNSLKVSKAGVTIEEGRIKTNKKLLTSIRRIYVAGDFASLYNLHIAGFQGYIFSFITN